MKRGGAMWRALGLAGLAGLLLGAADPAVETTGPVEREFSRAFDTRTVQHAFTAVASANAAGEYDLRVSLTTALSGTGQGRAARAGLANGYVAIALPWGWEAAGDLRLYYVDSAGSDQLLYSTGYPRLPRFAALGAEPDFRSAGTEAAFRYLRDTGQILDPAVRTALPADIDLRSNAGVPSGPRLHTAWLIPVSLDQTRLLNIFDAGSSGAAPQIVAKVRLRQRAASPDPDWKVPPDLNPMDGVYRPDNRPYRVKLYAGALSIAAAVVDAPASLAPPGAILLSTLDPRRYPAPAPAAPAADGTVPPEPRQPMLVYSGEWLSWETSMPLPGSAYPPAMRTREAAANGDTAPVPALETDAPGTTAIEVTPPPATPPATDPVLPGTTASVGGTTARQVELGTLPAAGADGETPLKPITGSAGVRASAGGNSFGTAAQGASLPPLTGYPGSTPGSTLFYGPGGPPNVHGGALAPPPMAAPGLGTMVLIPAGPFLMGTNAGTPYGDPDELPQHSVDLPDFYIDKYPVTNRQFGEFVVLAGHKADGDWQRYSSPSQLDMPVRNVSWNDANAYARWAGKRLPTEAEWEKAARGTDGRLFPWGNDWTADILPRGELGYQLLVAPKALSPYGVMAMAGVLWQWTATPFHDYPFNPNARGDKYVLRGGAYSNGRNIVRCANRYFEPRQMALNTFTFRCVKDKP